MEAEFIGVLGPNNDEFGLRCTMLSLNTDPRTHRSGRQIQSGCSFVVISWLMT